MYLVTADLHLTDRPKDRYRFDLFKWLAKQQEKYQPRATLLLGDLTDQKDKHSAALTNGLIAGLLMLKPPVVILRGNHDCINPKEPFFEFLNDIPGLDFIVDRAVRFDNLGFLAHCRTQEAFDQECAKFPKGLEHIFIHQMVDGAIAETGARLSGLSTAAIGPLKPRYGTYAGDIHRPQRAGNVTYVGSPYSIRFGDDFTPRVLLLRPQELNLYFDGPRKWSLTVRTADDILKNEDLLAGDQVKVTIELAREEAVEWKTYRQQIMAACEKKGLETFGVDLKVNSSTQKVETAPQGRLSKAPKDIILEYSKKEKLPSQVKEAGLALLDLPHGK